MDGIFSGLLPLLDIGPHYDFVGIAQRDSEDEAIITKARYFPLGWCTGTSWEISAEHSAQCAMILHKLLVDRERGIS